MGNQLVCGFSRFHIFHTRAAKKLWTKWKATNKVKLIEKTVPHDAA